MLLFLPPRAQRVLGGVPPEAGRGVLTVNGGGSTEYLVFGTWIRNGERIKRISRWVRRLFAPEPESG